MENKDSNVLKSIKNHEKFNLIKDPDLIDFLTDNSKDCVYKIPQSFEELIIQKNQSKLMNTSRWTKNFKVALTINGQLYITTYSLGLTEHQDVQPYEDDYVIKFLPAKKIFIEDYVL